MRLAWIAWTMLALLACLPAGAAERLLRLDPQATQLGFTLKATGHTVQGKLQLQKGEIRFDDETGLASGEITVDARLAETGNKRRDKKMHEKVLESEQYPLFRFEPSAIVGRVADEGLSEIELRGTMSIHGGQHPITLRADVHVANGRLTATAGFSTPYVEWGLHDPSMFLLRVAKLVEVTLATEGALEASPGAAN